MKKYSTHIEDYLQGEMDASNRAAFEQAMRQDADFSMAVEQQKDMQQRLRALKLRRAVSTALDTQDKYHQPSGVQISTKWLAVAASTICLMVALWFFYDKKSVTTVGAEQATSEKEAPQQQPSLPTPTQQEASPEKSTQNRQYVDLSREFYVPLASTMTRGAAGQYPDKTIFNRASMAFEQKNYLKAAQLLQDESLLDSVGAARFLRAHCRFQLGQYTPASADFKRLEGNFQFGHEARWNGFICDIARGKNLQDPAVNARLNAMLQDKDFPFREKAQAMKKRFNYWER